MPHREDILKKIDIVDVISSYIDLKKVGSNYSARCPFHPDDTPSFFVSPSKGIFKCFGCGVGGDAIKFVSLYENISYSEALLKLAKRYNIPIKLKETKRSTKMLQILELVANYYHNALGSVPRVVDYLKSRGISSKSAQKFMLGYSPSSEDLVSFLKKEGVLDAYEKTGNLIKLDEGLYRDLFAGRIIIPIRDERGNYIAFGGRLLQEGQPKYINSPESEFFKKRSVVFGLHQAREYIKEMGFVVIVEGYFDVIAMHQEGYKNTVAPLGTSFSQDHAIILSKYTKNAVLLFDGDNAGKKAVRLATPHLLSQGINVKVAYLPEGEDPDTMVRKDKEGLHTLVQHAQDIFQNLIEEIKEGKNSALKDFLYYAGFVKDKVYQHELIKSVSSVSGLPVSLLYEQIPKVQKVEEQDEALDLTYAEKVFLLGLMRLGKEEYLKEVLLSPKAMQIAEYILSGDYHMVPESIKNTKVYDLESAFETSYYLLKVEKSHFTEGTRSIKEKREEKDIKTVRFRRRC